MIADWLPREPNGSLARSIQRLRVFGMRIEDTRVEDLRVGHVDFEDGRRAFYPFGAWGRRHFVDESQVKRLSALPMRVPVRVMLPLELLLFTFVPLLNTFAFLAIVGTVAWICLQIRRILDPSPEAPHLP
jgi:hypothetical protein